MIAAEILAPNKPVFVEHNIPKLYRKDGTGGRLYSTPEGYIYPSVTTVLAGKEKEEITKWRERVGDAEADATSGRATRRGTAFHSLCENYLKHGKAYPTIFDVELFKQIVPFLDEITEVHCLETQLYSNHLRVAGTVDCIGRFRGKLTVIDFKTSGRAKTPDQVQDYLLQCAAYAVMFEERTGLPVNRLFIPIMIDNEQSLILEDKRDNWIVKFIEARDNYKALTGV